MHATEEHQIRNDISSACSNQSRAPVQIITVEPLKIFSSLAVVRTAYLITPRPT